MFENTEKAERAMLVAVDTGEEDTDSLLSELSELAVTAGAEVVSTTKQNRESPDSATFVGSGFLKDIINFCEQNEITLLIFDTELSPIQQRNIEEQSGVRTIDRTLLILDIFASRARSNEGRIQVQLAQYRYLLPRLVGKGLQLSRQGGIGMRRGAGESKLETDRRHIRRRIKALEEQLAEIDYRRTLQRERRKKNRIQTVAIVGYTNAGKSTLMNRLTDAGVLVEDMLFATLDPTARALKLPNGQNVMMIDTVGLIRKLPHHLVEAFKSTLQEAAESDVILNLCDCSSEEFDVHIKVTEDLIKELSPEGNMITVLNKCDRLSEPPKQKSSKKSVYISALEGTGIDELLIAIEEALPQKLVNKTILLPFSKAGEAERIRKNGVIISQEYVAEGLKLDCTVDVEMLESLKDYII